MIRLASAQAGILGLYTALFLFTFREACKQYVEWHAFQFHDWSIFGRKILIYSFPILILFPLVGYFAFSILIATVSNRFPIIALIMLFTCLLPIYTLNLWAYIAIYKINSNGRKGQPGYGWRNPDENREESLNRLPKRPYIIQILSLFTIMIVLCFIFIRISNITAIIPFNNDFWFQLFIVAYISELILMYYTGKKRDYFSYNPNIIISRRTIFTIIINLVLPIVVGVIGIIPLAEDLDMKLGTIWKYLLYLFLMFFPFYCNQSILLLARSRQWTTRREVFEGREIIFWWLCLLAMLISIILLFVFYFIGIYYI